MRAHAVFVRWLLVLVGIGLTFSFSSKGLGQAGKGGPPPGAIPDVNPVQYVLLKADVPADWGWSSPEIKEEAAGSGIVADGRQQINSWWRVILEQRLLVPVAGPDGRKRQVAVTIVGTILKTPEYTRAAWDRSLSSGIPPIGLPEAMVKKWGEIVSPEKFGEEAVEGTISGKPVGVFSFRFKSYVGHIGAGAYEFEAPETIAAVKRVARLMETKIAGAKPPVINGLDVAILPSEWGFTPYQYGANIPVEASADKQGVVAYVRNLSDKVPAQEIRVQLWLGQPGYQGSQAVGEPVTIKNLPPKNWRKVNLIWPLAGNVEKARLYVQALPTTQEDTDLQNNATGYEVTIHFASSGGRAYSLPTDGYSFVNWGMDPDDSEEVVESWLAGIVGHMQADPKLGEVMQRILFPQTYTRFLRYLDDSAKATVGGHCYGMSATSAQYFLNNLARPGGATTSALTQSQASFNINVYHRAQMRSAMEAALTGSIWHPRNEGVSTTIEAIRTSLRDRRQPIIIEFFGKLPDPARPGQFTYPGHAVLAYKLVEWGEGLYCTYLYDSNYPLSAVKDKAMPNFTFNTNKGSFTFANYMGYTWAVGNWVSAQPLTREIPASYLTALVPQVKQAFADTTKLLEGGKKLIALVRCPATMLVTDGQGRALGVRNGSLVSEIPGAQVLSKDGAKIFLLPAGQAYSISLARTGQGKIGFDLLSASAGGGIGVAAYDNLSVSGGSTSVRIAADGSSTVQAAGRAVAPSVMGSFDGSKVSAMTPGKPTVASTPTSSASTTPKPELSLYDNNNVEAVQNGPTTTFWLTFPQPIFLTRIETYHWNGGRGAAPGTISLVEKGTGRVFGSWKVASSSGQGGAPNVLWQARPNVVVPPGVYRVTVSAPETWSYNARSKGVGFMHLWGHAP